MPEFKGERMVHLVKSSDEGIPHMRQQIKLGHEAVAKGENIVVWATPSTPMPILYAMDLIVVSPLHYSLILAAKQQSVHYLEVTEAKGYYKDLCRYCSRCGMGAIMDSKEHPELLPWGGLPQPAAVLPISMCDQFARSWEIMAQEVNAPVFVTDQVYPEHPARYYGLDRIGWHSEHYPHTEQRRIDYRVKCFEELIVLLETVTGRKLTERKLRLAVKRTAETWNYWEQVEDMRLSVPCPVSTSDNFANVISPVFFRGTEFAVEHMRHYRDEVKERVDRGEGVVEDEKYRLLWVGYPVWFSPGFYQSFEQDYGAVFVYETYHFARFMSKLDPRRPIESCAREIMDMGGEAGLSNQVYGDYFFPAARVPGNIDGVIIGRAESCKSLSSSIVQFEAWFKKRGIPCLSLTMDYVDSREWDDERYKSRIGDFIESLPKKQRKPKKVYPKPPLGMEEEWLKAVVAE